MSIRYFFVLRSIKFLNEIFDTNTFSRSYISIINITFSFNPRLLRLANVRLSREAEALARGLHSYNFRLLWYSANHVTAAESAQSDCYTEKWSFVILSCLFCSWNMLFFFFLNNFPDRVRLRTSIRTWRNRRKTTICFLCEAES